MRGSRERHFYRVRVAARPAKAGFAYRCQLFVLHRDALGCILSLCPRLGEYRGNRFADVPHCRSRERPAPRLDHSCERPSRPHWTDAVFLHFGTTEDNQFSWGLDCFYSCMRMWRAQQDAVKHPGCGEIVDELSGAGEETQVLDAPDRDANHPSSSRSSSRRS